ncbi:MAG: hypothetical protein RLZZ368_1122 [Actinomycetota bacterium]|jgi:hypothetical protein
MNARIERMVADVALVATFVASFLTHENGPLLHSIVSVIFTVVLAHHVKHNWIAYRRPRRRTKSFANHTVALLMAAATLTGLIFWIGGDGYALAHGPLSIAAMVAVVPHVWVHRRNLRRLLKKQASTGPASQV